MVLAIAFVLLHLSPTTQTRIVADVASAAAGSAAVASAPLPPAPPAANSSLAPVAGEHSSAPTLADSSTTNTQAFSTLRLPEPQPAKPIRVIAAETTPPRTSWLILAFAQHGAAAFDAYTTRQAVADGAREDDPLMRPFAHSPAIYVASQITPTLLDYVARRMERSPHTVLRRSWWLPQSAGTALFIFAGSHNLNVINSRP